MQELTPEGHELIARLCHRHGFGEGAVTHLLTAVLAGNGSQAQFGHPEFGGTGQWMRGGMIMLGDMFNGALKGRVAALCNDIADALANLPGGVTSGSFQSQQQGGLHGQRQATGALGTSAGLFVADPDERWWPAELGVPDATGSQDDLHYALFRNAHRLAVRTGRQVWVYDTQDHQIGGFSQQQGTGSSIQFSSQFGTVALATLPVVSIDGRAPAPPESIAVSQPASASPAPATQQAPATPTAIEGDADRDAVTTGSIASTVDSRLRDAEAIILLLQRLGELHAAGVLTDDEFARKKAELLQRL